MQNNSSTKKMVRKPGRTLVVKTNQTLSTNGMTGLVNSSYTSNGSAFFVFDTVENSKNAFKTLKGNNEKVKFAHYRLFFTLSGVNETTSYNDLKTEHMNWITANSDANVLYYKQYRKDGKFLGCGDFTIDTKESMDKLLDKEGLKNFTFNTYSGVNYRYNNKKPDTEQLAL